VPHSFAFEMSVGVVDLLYLNKILDKIEKIHVFTTLILIFFYDRMSPAHTKKDKEYIISNNQERVSLSIDSQKGATAAKD